MLARSALALVVLALALARAGAAGESSPAEPDAARAVRAGRAVLVRADELHAGDGQVFAPGEMLVEDGKVKALGATVPHPEGVVAWPRVAVLTPWLCDPGVSVPLGGGESGRLESALLSAADARPSWEAELTELRESGLFAMALVPDGGTDILGRTAVVGTEGPGAAGAPLLAAPAQLAAALPLVPGSMAAAASRLSLPDLLEATAKYSKERAEWAEGRKAEAGPSKARPRDSTGHRAGRGKDDQEPKFDPAREVLAQVNEKKLPLRVRADRADDVRALLALARSRGIGLTLAGCRECGALAQELADSQASVVLEPLREPAWDVAGLPRDAALASQLAAAGARLAVTAGAPLPSGPAWLRLAAAELAGRGVPRALAIAAMTGEAARASGWSEGVLAPGTPARFLVWDGDPLDPARHPVRRVLPDDLQTASAQDADAASAPASPAPVSAIQSPAPRADDTLPVTLGAVPGAAFAVRARVFDGLAWLDRALVVVRDGRIASIAPGDAPAPAGTVVIDRPGSVLSPGFIDCDSALGLRGERDELQEASSQDLLMADAFAPDEGETRALAGSGVTLAWLAAGPASVVGARGALVQPSQAGPPRVIDARRGSCASLALAASQPDRAPSSVPAQAALIADVLARSGPQALPLRVRFDGAASARQAAALVAGLPGPRDRAGLVSGLPATRDALAELGAATERPLTCISRLGPSASLDQRRVAALAASQAPFVLGTGLEPAGARALRVAGAALVADGVAPERVLRALTRDAADAAGLADRGRVTPGAVADLVLWSGDPVSPASRALVTWIAGEPHVAP